MATYMTILDPVYAEGGNDAPALTGTPAAPQYGAADRVYTVTQAQLLQGFTDADGDALSVTGLTANRGTVTQNADGSWTITPTSYQMGALTLSYGVSDGTATTAATMSMSTYLGVDVRTKMSGTSAAEQFYGRDSNDSLYGGGGDDLAYGGGGPDWVFGQAGNDTLDGNAGNDLVDGGADNDLLVYRLAENAGSGDSYSGNTGIDVLRLELTAAEWASATVQSEVSRYATHLASVPRTNGEVGSDAASDFIFDFGGATTLKVQRMEQLQVSVDGDLVLSSLPDDGLVLLHADSNVTLL